MPLTHRPVDEKDIQIICGFPQSEDELFFLFPKAEFPLSSSQLRDAIAQRSDSTVVELGGEVIAFANFYRWESGGRCSIGNVIVSPAARGRGVGRYLIEQMIACFFKASGGRDNSVVFQSKYCRLTVLSEAGISTLRH
ncbi:MAG: GNAT family N-acetyltransferase [Acidithiobacillus ferrivorans]